MYHIQHNNVWAKNFTKEDPEKKLFIIISPAAEPNVAMCKTAETMGFSSADNLMPRILAIITHSQ